MQKYADITIENNTCLVSGDLSFANVMSVYEKSLSYLLSSGELNFDFSQVKSSDSAGLALILEWSKFAKSNNKNVRFSTIPPHLVSLAKAADMDEVINFAQ